MLAYTGFDLQDTAVNRDHAATAPTSPANTELDGK